MGIENNRVEVLMKNYSAEQNKTDFKMKMN